MPKRPSSEMLQAAHLLRYESNGIYVEADVLVFDRTDPNAIVCLYPKGHPDHPEGREVTLLEDLREGPRFRRCDMALVNTTRIRVSERSVEITTDQHAVYFGEDGSLHGSGVEYLSPADKTRLRDIAEKMLAVAAIHPEFNVYLRG